MTDARKVSLQDGGDNEAPLLRNRGHAATSKDNGGQAPLSGSANASSADESSEISATKIQIDEPPRVHKHREQTKCNQFMRSTPFKLMTLSVVGIVPAFGAVVALPNVFAVLEFGFLLRSLHCAITCWLCLQVLFNFAMSQFTDPGRTTGYQPTYAATGQYLLAPELDADDESTRILYAPNYCSKCQHWKPPRTHHCGMCGRCVLRMDHHCPFTGNCIGFRNHGHFALMYLFAFTGLFYSTAMCVYVLARNWWLGIALRHDLRLYVPRAFNTGAVGIIIKVAMTLVDFTGPQIVVQLILSIVFLLLVFSCGCPALQIVSTNATTIEMMFPMKDWVQIKPKVYVPLGVGFYRHSIAKNLRDVLGSNWRMRLFLPVRGALDASEQGPAILPLPAPEGTAALRERVRQVETEGVKSEVRSIAELGIDVGPTAQMANVELEPPNDPPTEGAGDA